jgi:hydrogenase maturation protein HypF
MSSKVQRLKISVQGAVQGVGFRPFVYRLATELSLQGWVCNGAQGVFIEVEGPHEVLEGFLIRLGNEKPIRAVIFAMEASFLDPVPYDHFEIRESDGSGEKLAVILPDIATCHDCLHEIFDPRDRRHLYPFTNCTNCGPRFSIIESLPYDRPNTSMHEFHMCARCEAEYHDPRNRRFHAQPNACPNCGPQLALWSPSGDVLATRRDAVLGTAAALRAGRIVALKGIGGFQLIVDARNESAVRRLRQRKHREEKPFALMYPYLDAVAVDCVLSRAEERLLHSPECPIVLLKRKPVARGKSAAQITDQVIAPHNPYLGVMLPYSPLHHLLMRELGVPIVATSGNLSDEPICIDEQEALQRLHDIADLFLVHNRRIVRHVDDSVVRVMLGREQVLRRARGYAPLPIHVKKEMPNVLAVGAHLKNTVALSTGHEIFLSQHIGDLETQPAYNAFRRVCDDFQQLYEVTPDIIACDMHPDYLSTKFARSLNVPIAWVQHHYAHVISCMTENEVEAPVLGISWDGTGYATDGTIWGGEFLHINDTSFDRIAHFRPFRLPGGEAAIKQPRRCALGVLYEIFGEKIFDPGHPIWKHFDEGDVPLFRQMLVKGVNSPVTSSVGRLFDAVASLIGLRQELGFEGQAAMELEYYATPQIEDGYPFEIQQGEPLVVDWEPMIRAILNDVESRQPQGRIAAQFHNTLAAIIVAVAKWLQEPKVALTGGCFQNRYLTERTVHLLEAGGFKPFWHQRVPPNDGGIALGQAIAAMRSSAQTPNPREVFAA